MDDTLRNAIERRDSLRRELEAWEAFITAYSTQLQEQRVEMERQAAQRDLFEQTRPSRAERAATVRAMMDEAERLILEAARPLTRSQLLELLEAQGHIVAGGDQSKVLGTNLWRSKRFHNIQHAGYWPRSVPIPAPFDRLPIRDTMLS